MTPRQEEHVGRILFDTLRRIDAKYRAGAAEHNGVLEEMSLTDLLRNAIDENTDLTTYLHTALEWLEKLQGKSWMMPQAGFPAGTTEMVGAMMEEMRQAQETYGEYTSLQHAVRVLDREVTELKVEMYNHRETDAVSGFKDTSEVSKNRPVINHAAIREEAIQIAATAIRIAMRYGTNPLNEGRVCGAKDTLSPAICKLQLGHKGFHQGGDIADFNIQFP